MTDHDAFLAAIVADPADDLPRLVYADYLDERGDPDRAAFIRLQVAAARGDPSGAARADELLAANKARWEIPELPRTVQTFRRGFVEAVRMTAGEFLAHADRIGRAAPVMAVRLSVVPPEGFVEELTRVSWLARLEELDLSNNVGLGNWLPDLLGAVPLPNLRALELRNNQLWPEAVAGLAARAARLPRLTRLNLSGNPIANEGMDALADAPALAGLTELVVRCDMVPFTDSVHAGGLNALARSRHLTRLRVLDLAGQYVGDAGLDALARSPNAAALEHLDVSHNDIGEIGDSGVEALVASPYPDRLAVLNLGGDRNAVSPIGAQALADWWRLAIVREVNLLGCRISDAARATLLASPHRDKFLLDEPTQSS